MSDDSFIAVFSGEKDILGRVSRWYVSHGMMPSIENPDREKDWKQRIIAGDEEELRSYPSREQALIAAHDMLKEESYPVEYGVIEI